MHSDMIAAKERIALREAGFSKIEKILDRKTAESIKKIYALTDVDTCEWFLSLYEPEIGGFYYSVSARDTEGYLPDLESTRQALGWFVDSGLFAKYGSFGKAIPEKIAKKIIDFTKSKQSETDGFFYHPQWGTDIRVSRRARDLNWATGILAEFGEMPLYNTPNGVKGLHNISSKTDNNSEQNANSSFVPEHLRSLESFAEYLNSLNIREKSYPAGNNLSCQAGQIIARGKEYVDYLVNYLNSMQYSHNGLWGENTDYSTVNGLMKISSTYSSLKAVIPNAEKALESAVKVALDTNLDTESALDGAIVSIYNPFVAMVYLLNAVRNSEGEECAEELRRRVIIKNSSELAEAAYIKLLPFKCSDGGFSYSIKCSSAVSQGAPVALKNTKEGDVNATTLAITGVVGRMFRAFGIDTVPFFGPKDGENFIKLLLNAEKHKKINLRPDYLL